MMRRDYDLAECRALPQHPINQQFSAFDFPAPHDQFGALDDSGINNQFRPRDRLIARGNHRGLVRICIGGGEQTPTQEMTIVLI